MQKDNLPNTLDFVSTLLSRTLGLEEKLRKLENVYGVETEVRNMTGLLDAICAADSAAAREAGRQEGMAQGREEALRKTAQLLGKEYGTPPEVIASYLDKSLAWVLEALQE